MIIGKVMLSAPKYWFAWRPVVLNDDGRVVWLQRVWRYWNDGTFHGGAHWAYAMSEEDAVAKHNMMVERSGYYGPTGPGFGKPNKHLWVVGSR